MLESVLFNNFISMSQHTLLSVISMTTRKDGSALVNKNGKPFSLVKIQVDHNGNSIYATGFDNVPLTYAKDWKVGDQVDIDIVENGSWQGMPQYNFKKAGTGKSSPLTQVFEKLKVLEERILILESRSGVISPVGTSPVVKAGELNF